MKKIIIATLIVLIWQTAAIAITTLYRLSSNEVYVIDLNDQVQTGSDYFAVITNATYPDGTQCRDSDFQLRVPGLSKILDGTVVRNATTEEIATFADLEISDFKQAEANNALSLLEQDPKLRRILKAVTAVILQELNRQRQWDIDFKAQVAASTSLANFQTRMASMSSPGTVSFNDFFNLVKNRIDPDD